MHKASDRIEADSMWDGQYKSTNPMAFVLGASLDYRFFTIQSLLLFVIQYVFFPLYIFLVLSHN